MKKLREHPGIKLPAKASMWYIASGAICRGVNVLGTPIFTRMLTPEEYGLFPLYTTWLGIFTVIFTLELSGGVVYRGLQKFDGERSVFIRSCLITCFGVFTAFTVLYAIFRDRVNEITGLSTLITSMMLIQIFANVIQSIYIARAKFEYKYKKVALIGIIGSIISPTVSFSVILLTKYKAEGKIFGALISAVAVSIPLLIKLMKKRTQTLFSPKMSLYVLRYNLPLLPHYLSVSALTRIGEITISRVWGREALGKYAIAHSLGMSLTMLTGGLLNAVGPWMVRKLKTEGIEQIRRTLTACVRAISLGVCLILSVCPETLSLIAPSEYRDVLPAIFPLSICILPMFVSNAVMSGEVYYEKSGISTLPSILSLLVAVLLCSTVMPRLDYRLMGFVILTSYVALSVLNCLVFRKLSGEMPLDLVDATVWLVICVLYGALSFLLRSVPMARLIMTLPLIPAGIFVGLGLRKLISEK